MPVLKKKFGAKPKFVKRKQLEKSVEQKAVDLAKSLTMLSRKMNGAGFRAWPDRCFFPPDMSVPWNSASPVLWVEFKREGEELTPAQADLHKRLKNCGQRVMTCWTFLQFEKALRDYMKEECGL